MFYNLAKNLTYFSVMKRAHSIFGGTLRIAIAAIVVLSLCSWTREPLRYNPWRDLSSYFNLREVYRSGSYYYFNSYNISRGLRSYTNKRLNNSEYYATVLGQNVYLRSEPYVSKSTARGFVNTGDVIAVQGASVYVNGKYWNYVYVRSGNSSGRWGYICTDFLIEQEKYQVLRDYVLRSPNSNISIATYSKYLNAIGDILVKLNINSYHPNLAVNVLDARSWGNQVVVAFQIRNLNIQDNDSLLAYVSFTKSSNDYVVLGIVPGQRHNSISQMSNGSYNIYFNL